MPAFFVLNPIPTLDKIGKGEKGLTRKVSLYSVLQDWLMASNRDHEVMDVDGLAEYLKLSKSSVYKMLRVGKIPGRKMGKCWRFHKDAISQWLKEGQRGKSK